MQLPETGRARWSLLRLASYLDNVDVVVIKRFPVELVDELRDANDVLLAVVDGHTQDALDAVSAGIQKLRPTQRTQG